MMICDCHWLHLLFQFLSNKKMMAYSCCLCVFFSSCHHSYEKLKTTRSWLSFVIGLYWCSSQRESSLLLCFWSFEKGRKFSK
jgi:hypothetical protein